MNFRHQSVVLFVSFLLMISIGAGTALLGAPVAAESITEADRTIEDTELQAGETTTVTVSVSAESSGNITVIDEIAPAVDELTNVDFEPAPVIQNEREANDGTVAIWSETDSATIEYELTIPDDATVGETFEFDGTATLHAEEEEHEVEIAGDQSIEVVDPDPAEFQVSDLSQTEDEIDEGDALDITATVENIGDESGEQQIDAIFDGETYGTETVSLEGGETTTVSFTLDSSEIEPGEYTHSVESEDDAATGTVTIAAVDPAEFVITDFSPADETINEGDSIEVSATIENIGDESAEQTIEGSINGEIFDEESVELEPGETDSVTFQFDSTDHQTGTFDVGISTENDAQTSSLTIDQEDPTDDTDDVDDQDDVTDVDDIDEDDSLPGFGIVLALFATIIGAKLALSPEE